jgi:hypothetical protein
MLGRAGAPAALLGSVVWHQWPALMARAVGCTRPVWAVPRHPTSLLRMHCALTV